MKIGVIEAPGSASKVKHADELDELVEAIKTLPIGCSFVVTGFPCSYNTLSRRMRDVGIRISIRGRSTDNKRRIVRLRGVLELQEQLNKFFVEQGLTAKLGDYDA